MKHFKSQTYYWLDSVLREERGSQRGGKGNIHVFIKIPREQGPEKVFLLISPPVT